MHSKMMYAIGNTAQSWWYLKNVVSALLQTTGSVHILGMPECTISDTAVYRQIFTAKTSISMQRLILLDKEAYQADHLNVMIDIIPLMLAFDLDVLLFCPDCREELYLNGNAAAAYIDFFANQFHSAPFFVRLHSNLNDFLECWNEGKTDESECVYSIAKSHSPVLFASTEAVKSHMLEYSLFNQFMNMFQNDIVNERVSYSYFWEEAVSEILYSEEYYEYGKNLSASIGLAERRLIFQNFIAFSKADSQFVQGMFRSTFSKDTNLFGINICSSRKDAFAAE